VRTQSEHARDYLYGRGLARVREAGEEAGPMSEGARAALAGVRLATRLGVRVPVLGGVAAVIAGELSPAQAAAALADTVAAEE
jgi:glycerol-3-phosphate dehydrogenase